MVLLYIVEWKLLGDNRFRKQKFETPEEADHHRKKLLAKGYIDWITVQEIKLIFSYVAEDRKHPDGKRVSKKQW
jgi:hypothetical protein